MIMVCKICTKSLRRVCKKNENNGGEGGIAGQCKIASCYVTYVHPLCTQLRQKHTHTPKPHILSHKDGQTHKIGT